MTAIVLPDIDRSTLAELKDRLPNLRLSDIELPSMERAGREADQAIDRVLGRSRPTIWPWLAVLVGLAAVAGATIALLGWSRRPAWPESATPASAPATPAETFGESDSSALTSESIGLAGEDTEFPMEGGRP